jgi:hypothetical protein
VVVVVLSQRARASYQAEHKRRRRNPFHGLAPLKPCL